VNTFSERLNSPRFVKRVSWVAALVFVAGVVAFTVAYFGNTAESEQVPVRPNEPAQGVQAQGKTVPLDRQARVVAGEFILTAVQRDVPNEAQLRENLAKAWKLLAPGSPHRDCGGHKCTYKEWLTGDIPIQPYPAGSLDQASFSIEESYANQVVLQVALLPKDGADVAGQIFWISLLKQNGKWLVNEWSPRVIVPVPVAE
jgi:hypothetical protein